MKTKELIHIFNSQTKAKGRCGNVFFEGSKLYDYGYHYLMAHILPNGVALINSRGYSVTTAKHVRFTRQALSNRVTYEVPNPSDPKDLRNREHLENGIMNSIDAILSSRPALGRWTDGTETINAYKSLNKDLERYNDFCVLIKVPKALKVPESFLSELEAIAKANDVRTLELKAIRDAKTPEELKSLQLKREALKAKKLEQDRQLWIDGKTNSIKGFSKYEVRLRVLNEVVETTRGAKVPLNEAIKLFKRIELGVAKEGETVGHYTFNGVNNEQEIMIGCHRIDIDEARKALSHLVVNKLELVQNIAV